MFVCGLTFIGIENPYLYQYFEIYIMHIYIFKKASMQICITRLLFGSFFCHGLLLPLGAPRKVQAAPVALAVQVCANNFQKLGSMIFFEPDMELELYNTELQDACMRAGCI